MKRMKYFVISLLIFCSLVSCTKETTSPNNGLINPTNLVITLIENGLIKLNWDDNSTKETTFSIDKKIGEGNWFINYNEVAENITTFNDQIPTNTNTVYSYRIRAFDGNNYSNYSNNVGWFSYNSSPSNLSLEQITQDSIKINWQDNSFGEEGFSLDRKIGTEEWISNYKIIEQNETQYTDHSNSLNEVSFYRISAFSGSSNSLSIYDSVQVLLPSPTNLNATVVDDDKIRLDWIDNSITEEGFKIERKRTLEDYEIIAEVNENLTSYIDENVETGITYYYKVFAFTQEVQSYYSNEIAASITQIELWVPEIYPTIQSAIDAANDDEVVLVHPGTYFENINFNGKNITVESSDGAYVTIIDGNEDGSVVKFCNYEDTTSVLRGFTLMNGNGTNSGYSNYSGGGVYCNNSSPKLENLVIKDNSADAGNTEYGGGGIYCKNASPHIMNTEIFNNDSSRGGGIYCNESNPILNDVNISNNSGIHHGGGILIDYSSNPTLNNVTVTENFTYNFGGGICINDSDSNISNLIVENNISNYNGGGIYCENSDAIFSNLIIINNSAVNGGGMYCENSSANFINVNIVNNSSGGGISVHGNDTLLLFNSILWNNASYQIYSYNNNISVTYSDIQGGWTGTGNINSNPLFIGGNDFHLQLGSPCIDAGNPDSQYNDPDGSRNDMGAYGGPNGDW